MLHGYGGLTAGIIGIRQRNEPSRTSRPETLMRTWRKRAAPIEMKNIGALGYVLVERRDATVKHGFTILVCNVGFSPQRAHISRVGKQMVRERHNSLASAYKTTYPEGRNDHMSQTAIWRNRKVYDSTPRTFIFNGRSVFPLTDPGNAH